MKTPEEFCVVNQWWHTAAAAVRGRDDEWRRLVEEAQGERDAIDVQLQQTQADYGALEAERDRLKGELAEARRTRCAAGCGRRLAVWVCDKCTTATPAERAQGEAAQPVPVGVAIAALAKRMDALEHEAQEDAKAWADAALTLMNRVTKLEVKAPPPPEVAGSAVQFTGLCKVCGQLVSNGREVHRECEAEGTVRITLGRSECGLASPEDTSEAAGPGHAFVDVGADGHCGHVMVDAIGWEILCGLLERDHAVPPIPEGGAP